MTTHTRQHRRRDAAGFTLVELMISIALVLVLILGINQIFGLTSRTVSSGQALSAINRDGRTVQNVIASDFRGIALDAPLVIRSERVVAFRNAQDRDGDPDAKPETFDPTGTSGAQPNLNQVAPWFYNERNHRTDVIGFFARGTFTKQTGLDPAYVDTVTVVDPVTNKRVKRPVTSSEAWIWYGHLILPNPVTGQNFQEPGYSGSNVHDAATLATNWYLGRVAMLLHPNPDSLRSAVANDPPIGFIVPNNDLQAFLPGRQSPNIALSQYDLLQTTIGAYNSAVAARNASLPQNQQPYHYWEDLTGASNAEPWRFAGNPAPPRPLNAFGAAQTVPCYMRGCTQFIVEYAGDFCTENADGQVIKTGVDPNSTPANQPISAPDGIIDFDVIGTGANAIRKTRWYGYPRQVTNDPSVTTLTFHDVRPLADYLNAADVPISQARFERQLPSNNLNPGFNDAYIVAWGPDLPTEYPKPSMLRITITLDDPTNRVTGGQTFEYVIKLQ